MKKNKGKSTEGPQGGQKGGKAKGGKGPVSVASEDGGRKEEATSAGGGVLQQSGSDSFWKSELEVECPLKWLREYVEKLPKHSLEYAGSVDKYLDKVYNQNRFILRITAETGGDATNDQENTETSDGPFMSRITLGSHEWTAGWLCMTSILAYKGSSDRALGLLRKLRKLMKKTTDKLSESHQNAYEYLIDANLATTMTVPESSRLPESTKDAVVITRFPEGLGLYERWTQLMEDPKCVAVVQFVRGQMASILNLAGDISLSRFRKCAGLEPAYYMWHEFIYYKLRQMRKQGGGSAYSSGPSSEEVGACTRAYNFSPQITVSVYNFAVMKKECLFADMSQRFREKVNKSGEAEAEQLVAAVAVIELLEEVVSLAQPNSQTSIQAHLHLVEMYSARGLDLDERLAKDTIDRCVKQWPTSSMVLHKAGKFYQNGGSSGRFKDAKRAKKMYTRALQLCPSNYPCIMDALRHLGRQFKQHDAMIEMIDRCMNIITQPQRLNYLLVLKGVCLWLHHDYSLDKKENACRYWLAAVHRYPWMADKVAGYIISKSSEVFGHVNINPDEVSEHICAFCQKEIGETTKPLVQLLHGLDVEKMKHPIFYKSRRNAQSNPSKNPNGGRRNDMSWFNTKSKSKRIR